MILHVELDASYLVMPGARIHVIGSYYLSDHPTNPTNPSYVKPDGTIITKCKTLRHIVFSNTESETGGVFINVQHIVTI